MSNKIELRLKNYKQYSEKEFKGEGYEEAFIGHNGSGKSSAIQAIEECLLAKNFVKTPIKQGETEAGIVFKYQIEGKEPIQIAISISGDNCYEFTAAYIKDGKVKNIQDPKKIRELIGVYYPLTTELVFQMIATAEGRRKLIQDYFVSQFKEESKKRLDFLQNSISDKKNKATENNLYHTRTEKQRVLTGIEGELKASVLSEEDKTTIASKEAVIKALNKLKEEKEAHKGDGIKRKELEVDIQTLTFANNTILNELIRLETIFLFDFTTQKTFISEELNKLITSKSVLSNNLYPSSEITLLEDKITRGNNKLTEIATLEKRTTNTDAIARRDKIFNEINKLNEDIIKNKEEIKLIYSNSSLPAGLEIDEDIIRLNGFELSESTVSNTEARLAIIELLCKLNTSGFCNIGDFSLYDSKSRQKLLDFAKKNNMIFIGQLISEDTETKLTTLIIDN